MSLHELVIDAAARHPDRIAVAGPEGTLTYSELDRQADAMAMLLTAHGVGAGDRVVIWAAKSGAVVAAMQAVLRLGAVYVPIDGSTPVNRAASVARDCAARVVVTMEAGSAEMAAELGPHAACVMLGNGLATDPPPVNSQVAGDDLAYILYTSGSTGAPKGVCISHANARAFVDWAVEEIAPVPDDRFSSHAPFTFDLSVLDLYAAFAVGASVHLIAAELSYAPAQLVEFVYRSEISVWYSVPSALTLMMREGGLLDRPAPPSLRAILFAGEPFPLTGVRSLSAWCRSRLLNLYGPTETNVCTFHEVTPADLERDRPVPIGTPCSGDSVWAVTAGGTTAGPGEEGELYVSGPTVMPGYWGREPHEGPYATGDIVRVLTDGSFDYVGRRDHMVKVRGHRIELGDIETTLGTHPDIESAAVVVTGEGLDGRLEAFAVPRAGANPGVLSLKRHCAERLPRYMVVDTVHLVPTLPRTGNGKVDRATLVKGITTTRKRVS
ncbi:amino acid adenylation domain-containing protein [Streptomyces sp. NPDC048516]|uniref:amino acid adenylation domain-containing protein n=1 Tax=Streptomyces sp. NPDC048516 TaxID=3365565 RepID=UPI00371C1EAF